MTPMLDGLEDRVVLSQLEGFHRHAHHVASSQASSSSRTTTTSTAGTTTGTTSSASNKAIDTARQALRNDIQTIELASGTTFGHLTAIRAAFQTLAIDGLKPSNSAALASFEDSLVRSFANGTTLTAAYNALAAAVTSSHIISANLTTIDADQAAVLAAAGSTSPATFPDFSLVNGRAAGPCKVTLCYWACPSESRRDVIAT